MSMLAGGFYSQGGGGGGVTVTVSGENISHSVANGNTARAGVRVNTDGTIDKLEGTAFTQIDATTDWRIPNGSGSGYHVRFTKGILDPAPNYDPDSTTLGTWYSLASVSRRVGWEETADDTENGGRLTIAISDDGGSTILDSGNYDCTATVGTPI